MSFFNELKRRNVFRVAVAYLVTAWVLLQIADLVLQNIHAPDWVIQAFMLALALGFPLAVIFAWAFELTPEGLKKEKDVDRTRSITPQTGRKLDYVIIGVLAVAVVILLLDRFGPEKGSENHLQAAAQQAGEQHGKNVAPTSKEKSIAVLPFVNMSSDPEQDYFSDGISEEILNALARVKELKVAGRTSSFEFKGQNQDLRKIGETLGVGNILEGSVRKSGNKVRITAQLIQVEDGFHLWSDTYDRELTDIFAIQDEIAGAILKQLKAQLLEGEEAAVVATRANSEAYDLYLLAKQRLYERSRPTLEAAAQLLDKAIAIDANYAPAYAQRGITALMLSDRNYGTVPADQAEAQAKLYIDQALRLNPQDAEALAGLGLYYINRPGNTAEAIEALTRALSINPNLVDAANWLQAAYSSAGRLAESLQIQQQTIERDPLYRPGIANITNSYTDMGKFDEAQALIERIRPSMPNDPFLFRMEATVHYARGEYARGLLLAEQALSLNPDHYPNQGLVGYGLLVTGQYERLAQEGHPWQRAVALYELGRREEATLLAQKMAMSGEDVGTLIGLLANSGQQQAAVKFFEERWPDLDAYEAAYPTLGRGGIGTMLDIAYAYASTGNEARFSDAMRRANAGLQALQDLDVQNNFLPLLEAAYASMSGDPDTALDKLSLAVDRGLLLGSPISEVFATLKSLEGNPQFEAIQARMKEHFNAERAELGLAPLST
jgi:TolB-like protein/lipopolysaccharide biosynthesis regulator YciM